MDTPKKRNIFKTLSFLGILLVIVYLLLVSPHVFLVLLNVFWLLLTIITITFLILGTLTILGKKQEAGKIIDLVLKGSITVIDITSFLKTLVEEFKKIVKMVVVLIIPYLSLVLAFILYLVILYGYKYIGKTNDVFIPTLGLSIGLTLIIGILNRPKKISDQVTTWIQDALKLFNRSFIDSLEIFVFILFLTIDSTKLFFLPQHLNIPLHSKIGGYDLMTRSIVFTDHASITFMLIGAGILLELTRNILRLFVTTIIYYKNPDKFIPEAKGQGRAGLFKGALKKTVADAKDEILYFSAFTTFMMIVFLLFPRLKLIALIGVSAGNLIIDLVFPQRLTMKKPKGQEDIISRTFDRIFRIRTLE